MKVSVLLALGWVTIVAAAPPMLFPKSYSLPKNASVADVPTTGFATQNGGTTGGRLANDSLASPQNITPVSTFAQLEAAVKGDIPRIVMITGPITSTGNVKIGSNKTVIGKNSSAKLTGFTLTVKRSNNVIIRNLAISKVVDGDAIAIQYASNVWIDHVDLSSDRDHDKDYYDGLLDVTHAGDFVTVSNSILHDHWKCSLVGHSDNNGAEDKGHLRITYHNNYWKNVNSRAPSIRFGVAHIYNNYYENVNDGINTRDGAQVLAQNNVFVRGKKALYSTDSGYAVATGNDFGESANAALQGTLTKMPYQVPSLLPAADVKAAVVGTAGVTLSF
ncbi:pectin lyase-like protein [Polyplosphaeria fusca]|uniref:pectate lyase n=1 Tax=Polyplosphaeria fusca TaxID=682080 RepID=A0A9P4QSZ6_9PLEO|nr:pectin lyase-like protein [Polyplosphaeria fusca]